MKDIYIDYKSIKKSAKQCLKGNWITAILCALVYSIVSIIGALISDSEGLLFSMLNFIFHGFLVFGYTEVLLKIARGGHADITEIFDGCRNFLHGVGMILVVQMYTFLWSLLLIVPGIVAAIKYSMTYYIWVDNPDIGIDEAIKQSIEMTDGHKMEIFKLYLSFIGWILLISALATIVRLYYPEYFTAALSFGMIFVTPYVGVSFGTVYTKLLKEKVDNGNFEY